MGSAADAFGADLVFKVTRPADDELAQMKRGTIAGRNAGAICGQSVGREIRKCRRRYLRDGVHAAHLARAVDGRPVVAIEPRRLQGRDRCGGPLRPHLPADDDVGRHDRAGARLRDGRGRRGPAGDRDRQAPRRHRLGDRRAPGDEGAGPIARRHVRHGRGRGNEAGRNRRRLRQGNVRRLQAEAGRAHRRDDQEARHRHHDRADPRPPRAGARHRSDGAHDEAGLRDRRSWRPSRAATAR